MKDLIPVSITGIHSPQETWIMIIYQKKSFGFKSKKGREYYTQVSERKLKLFALFHESGRYTTFSQLPLGLISRIPNNHFTLATLCLVNSIPSRTKHILDLGVK